MKIMIGMFKAVFTETILPSIIDFDTQRKEAKKITSSIMVIAQRSTVPNATGVKIAKKMRDDSINILKIFCKSWTLNFW